MSAHTLFPLTEDAKGSRQVKTALADAGIHLSRREIRMLTPKQVEDLLLERIAA